MAKYLDLNGLSTFWGKIKTYISNLSGSVTGTPGASKTITSYTDAGGKTTVTFSDIQIAESQVTNLTTDLAAKAPLASPALTGTPTAPTASAGTNTTQIATTAFVNTAITNKMSEADAMIYKGVLSGGPNTTAAYGTLTPTANKGWTYKIDTAGYIDGVKVEVGDMIICNTDNTAAATASNYTTIAANWDFIQGNLEGVVLGPASSTDTNVAIFDGTTGKLIKDSGFTIGASVPSGAEFTDTKVTSSANHYTPSTASGQNKTATASGATAAWSIDVVKGVTLNTDGKGHVTGLSVTSGKIPANPNTDTMVTAVENHYEPAEDSSAAISASGGDATQLPSTSTGSLVQVVTGLKRDAAGHVVGVTSAGLWATNTTYTQASLGQGYGTCSTAEATAAKVVTLSGYNLHNNGFVAVKFTNGLCASATMNINSRGAKNIFIHGAIATATTCKEVLAGDIAYFIYDGTQYQFLGTDRLYKSAIVGLSISGTTITYTLANGTTGSLTTQDNDTKNTAGSTDSSSKLFLIGATSQAANPQTYSHDTAYVGTDGCLYSNSQKVLTTNVAASTYEPIMTAITDAEIEALT